MALTSRIARPLLASIFFVGGLDAVRNPASKSQNARAVTEPLREQVGMAGMDTETMVRINGGIQVAASVLLAIGRARRLACLVLIGSLVPTTYAGHRFWVETDDATRTQQRVDFIKNLGLLGGLILAAADTEGEPSFSWRAKRRVRQIEHAMIPESAHGGSPVVAEKSQAIAAAASKARKRGIRGAHIAGDRARRRVSAAASNPRETLAQAREGIKRVQETVNQSVHESSGSTTQAVRQAAALISETARQIEPLVESKVQSGVEVASEALSELGQHLATR